MVDPNQGASRETLDRLRAESYERTRLQILQAVEQQLRDYGMTWDYLAEKLQWRQQDNPCYPILTGLEVKQVLGGGRMEIGDLNQVAAVFSAEVYTIFRPRLPWIPRR